MKREKERLNGGMNDRERKDRENERGRERNRG